MAHDMLRFSGGIADEHIAGWDGPWPPPERWGVAVGHESGYVSIFSDAIAEAQLEEVKSVAKVQFYKLVTASQLPSEVRDHPNVARGARYEPDGEEL